MRTTSLKHFFELGEDTWLKQSGMLRRPVFPSGMNCLLNIEDFAMQVGAGIVIAVRFFTGGGNRRSISTAQFLADLGQCAISFLSKKIHSQAPG